MKTFLSRLVFLAGGGLGLLACGSSEDKVEAPIRRETPADEVLRIGSTWRANSPEQKILSPPSAISMLRSQRASTLSLSPQTAHEELVIEEDIELRSGGHASCITTFSHDLQVRWGRRNGEAAVELVRPALSAARQCTGNHPEPLLQEPQRRALLVLRSDQLQVVEPAMDKRQYLPLAD